MKLGGGGIRSPGLSLRGLAFFRPAMEYLLCLKGKKSSFHGNRRDFQYATQGMTQFWCRPDFPIQAQHAEASVIE
jgi:hypothetical protein